MNVRSYLAQTIKFFNPLPPVGGLEIGDAALRFTLFREGKSPLVSSLRIPPGIVEGGKVKDVKSLVMALRKLHAEVASPRKPLHVVLLLPPHLVYTQSFMLPFVEGDRLNEAVQLNLQILSPMDFEKAYASWQKIGESFTEGGQSELLAAFAERGAVEVFIGALREAGFLVAAVEFPALALVRFLRERANARSDESYLVVSVGLDGTSLMIVRFGNLYFNHFHPWSAIQEEMGGKKLSGDDFRAFVMKEVQKVLNFYSGRWGGTFGGAIVVASGLESQIGKLIQDNFGIKLNEIAVKEFAGIDPAWFPVFGAALRGLMPRGDDKLISLTNEPVEVQYREARTLSFIGLWRKILITVTAFILIVFGGVGFVLLRQEQKWKAEGFRGTPADIVEVQKLEAEAKAFNETVARTLKAKEASVPWSNLLKRLGGLTGEVTLLRLSITESNVLVGGSAGTEAQALAFRDRLIAESSFADVLLPFEDIKTNGEGSVDFSLTFRMKIAD